MEPQHFVQAKTSGELHLPKAAARDLEWRDDGCAHVGQAQTNPLDNVFDQIANSWKIRLNHDYIINASTINHITVSADRYYNQGLNKTNGQGWDQRMGILGIPADTGAFPQVNFSGGAVSPAQLNRGYDEDWHDLRYSFIENLTWIKGKHTFKAGFQVDRDRINRRFLGGAQGIFSFTNSLTSQPNSPSFGAWGNSYASFLIGAADTATVDIQPKWGARFLRYRTFVQDEWRATRALTVSYGLRWDYNPPVSEVYNRHFELPAWSRKSCRRRPPGRIGLHRERPRPHRWQFPGWMEAGPRSPARYCLSGQHEDCHSCIGGHLLFGFRKRCRDSHRGVFEHTVV